MQPVEQVISQTLEKYKEFMTLVPNQINYIDMFTGTPSNTIVTYYPSGTVAGISRFEATAIYDHNAAVANPEIYFPEQISEHQKYHKAITTELEFVHKARNITIDRLRRLEMLKEEVPEEIVNLYHQIRAIITAPKYWRWRTTRDKQKKAVKETLEIKLVGHKILSEAFDNGEEYMKAIASNGLDLNWKESARKIIQYQGEISTMHDRIVLELGKELYTFEENAKITL